MRHPQDSSQGFAWVQAQSLRVVASSRGDVMHTNHHHHNRQDMMYTMRKIQVEFCENAE